MSGLQGNIFLLIEKENTSSRRFNIVFTCGTSRYHFTCFCLRLYPFLMVGYSLISPPVPSQQTQIRKSSKGEQKESKTQQYLHHSFNKYYYYHSTNCKEQTMVAPSSKRRRPPKAKPRSMWLLLSITSVILTVLCSQLEFPDLIEPTATADGTSNCRICSFFYNARHRF